MNLHEIPKEESVLIDANIFLYTHNRSSEECFEFLDLCAETIYTGFVPSHIMSEVMHVIMLGEARKAGFISGSNPARQLSEKTEMIKSMWEYNNIMSNILDTGITIASVNGEDLHYALRLQRLHGLMTNDSIFLAVAHRLGIRAIASADKAFRNIPSIDLYEPGDL